MSKEICFGPENKEIILNICMGILVCKIHYLFSLSLVKATFSLSYIDCFGEEGDNLDLLELDDEEEELERLYCV